MKFEDLDKDALDYVENKKAEDEIVETASTVENKKDTPVVEDTPTTSEDKIVELAPKVENKEDTPVVEDTPTTAEDEIIETAPTVENEDQDDEDSTDESKEEDEYEPNEYENINVEVIVFTFQRLWLHHYIPRYLLYSKSLYMLNHIFWSPYSKFILFLANEISGIGK